MGKKKQESEANMLGRVYINNHRDYKSYNQVKMEFDKLGTPVLGGVCVSDYDLAHLKSGSQARLARRVLNHISGKNLFDVIDFGCGTGLSGKFFADLGCVVDGVDISENMMRYALRRGYTETFVRNMAGSNLNIPKKYDVAISCGVSGEYIPGDILVPNMVFVLKPHAYIGLTNIVDRKSLRDIKKILNKKRFEIVQCDREQGPEGARLARTEYDFIVARRL